MSSGDSMLDIYLYENTQLLEKLESLLLTCESSNSFTAEQIGEIFRILHTIKGSSAMMNFEGIANLSHALEDLFDYMRSHNTRKNDYPSISKLTFETLDTINAEIAKIQGGGLPDGDTSKTIQKIRDYLTVLTNRKDTPPPDEAADGEAPVKFDPSEPCYTARIFFQKECKMENIRAFGIVKSIENFCESIVTIPKDLLGENSADEIIQNGCTLYMASNTEKAVLESKIREAFFIQSCEFKAISAMDAEKALCAAESKDQASAKSSADTVTALKQNYMSVNLNKLDMLMDIVGEIVITESTVTKNPEVVNLHLENFEKASRQLRKLTDELQDIVMSIRMVPVSATFHKMERIVRDMSVKIDKKAKLVIIGEDTEIDKNVLDNLSDPLMHIVRNAMDHGLEPAEERKRLGKNPTGEIVLEARNSGSDVLIIISDNGRGLNREALIDKGIEKGLVTKDRSEITDKEAYSLIFTPGFSTRDQVTEFSGRGVGMDVALKNIEKMGGSVTVDSMPGQGMRVTIRIPLTLAIIDGMLVSVGSFTYIIPLLSIKNSFKVDKKEVFSDPSGTEMIYLRGVCYPIMRLHKVFDIETSVTEISDGILVLVTAQSTAFCLFVDDLVGEQKTVVKPIPAYITRNYDNIKSMAGCTILGDGSISVILDINGLMY
jgi:Chemotaxis protein histidine kinase and related kinases